LFHSQIHAIQRQCRSKRFAQTACFYACHGFSVPPLASRLTSLRPFHSVALPASAPAAGSSLEFAATLLAKNSFARSSAEALSLPPARTSRARACSPPVLRPPIPDIP